MALIDPKRTARFADLGSIPKSMPFSDFGKFITEDTKNFGKFITEDTKKWGKVIRAANLKGGVRKRPDNCAP